MQALLERFTAKPYARLKKIKSNRKFEKFDVKENYQKIEIFLSRWPVTVALTILLFPVNNCNERVGNQVVRCLAPIVRDFEELLYRASGVAISLFK